jgi:1-pyrroline-5-carboxylate dehydrogenase
MQNGIFAPPAPVNEHVYNYAKDCPEADELALELARQSRAAIDIPLVIGGEEIRTGATGEIRAPHDKGLLLATYHKATPELVNRAAAAAVSARSEWSRMAWHARAAIFLKAADLLATRYRQVLNAATMLGQSKSVYQAEIDSACELIDFFRFNVHFADQLYRIQPELNGEHTWNRLEYRALEGFILAVTPFNFTSIGGNLPTAPAIMGNAVIWKPASTAVLSNYYLMRLLKEAGLPDGVINFVPGDGASVGGPAIANSAFAGLHFTGSTSTFNAMWLDIARNIAGNAYKGYPRIVGETGGKDFLIAHPDCDTQALAVALFRGAFEYQGQKCSATSRAYVPRSIWPAVRDSLAEFAAAAKMGDVADFSTFMGAVIDGKAYRNIVSYIEFAKAHPEEYRVAIGGDYRDEPGWFVPATVIETSNPIGKLMTEEIFGPVLTVYVYDDSDFDQTLALVGKTSPFALTGSIFANDRGVIERMEAALSDCAGNFYINDKSTGAVVGQQPFGGARASGTNDKAGSLFNLIRWTSVRSIKEAFLPAKTWDYPHQRVPGYRQPENLG